MRNFPIDPVYTKNMISQQDEINGGDNVNGLMSLVSGIRHRIIENLNKRLSSEKSALLWQRKFDYFYIIIVVIGLLGNIICIVTLLFCKPLSKNLVNKYLVVLLLSDTLFNLWILAVFLNLRIITWKFWTCVVANHIYHGTVCASSNVIVLLTMERFFAIVFPLQHMQYHHISRLKLVAIFLLPMQLWTIYFDLLPYIDPEELTSATMLRRFFRNDVCEYRALLSVAMVYIPFYISILILPLFSAIFVNIIILIKLRKRPKPQNSSTPLATIENQVKSDDSHRILWILPLIYIALTTPNVVTQIVGQVRDSSTFRKAFVPFWSQKLKRIRFSPTSAVTKTNNNPNSVSVNAGKLDSGTSRETQETDL
ncbi:7 transmembrane receptor (rhodopsin family) domain-containing protein [Ditylenchus destructor]|uniref:7 transmembrane receptor (Rhodopsin family) domain-containing protein n=1 Tax=Ditylenchus destructor TaxID=166010 RepID=A0AAD4MSP3_9BILA|nr:7 transmembrane receptor (rhodopsin family) domain-containing protein [Ditylenchus destructor]